LPLLRRHPGFVVELADSRNIVAIDPLPKNSERTNEAGLDCRACEIGHLIPDPSRVAPGIEKSSRTILEAASMSPDMNARRKSVTI